MKNMNTEDAKIFIQIWQDARNIAQVIEKLSEKLPHHTFDSKSASNMAATLRRGGVALKSYRGTGRTSDINFEELKGLV